MDTGDHTWSGLGDKFKRRLRDAEGGVLMMCVCLLGGSWCGGGVNVLVRLWLPKCSHTGLFSLCYVWRMLSTVSLRGSRGDGMTTVDAGDGGGTLWRLASCRRLTG